MKIFIKNETKSPQIYPSLPFETFIRKPATYKVSKRFPFVKRKFYKTLFENEHRSDVILMVGEGSDRIHRVPVHSFVLSDRSEFFNRRFNGSWGNSEKIAITENVDAFYNVIRWMYTNNCELDNFECNVDTLMLADFYGCLPLAKICFKEIFKQINTENVVKILDKIFLRVDETPLSNELEKLKGLEKSQDTFKQLKKLESNELQDTTLYFSILFSKCLSVIDKEPEIVIKQKDDLSKAKQEVFSIIMSRDTLILSSELLVIEALTCRATYLCRIKHKEMTPEGRQEALAFESPEMLFLARFLTLSSTEVKKLTEIAETDQGLLTKEQLTYVGARVNRIPPPPVDAQFRDAIEMTTSPRGVTRTQKESKKSSKYKELFYDFIYIVDNILG